MLISTRFEIFQFCTVPIFGKPKSRKCIVIKPNIVARVYWVSQPRAPRCRAVLLHAVSCTFGMKKAISLKLYFETVNF